MTVSQPIQPSDEAAEAGAPMFCANHPDAETYLRCNKCGKPICLKCAALTEVGYRCKECIREQQNVFYNAMTSDNWIAFAVAAGITLVAWPFVAWLFLITGFFGWIIAALIGSGAGASLAQIIRKSVGRRRGRYIRHFTIAGIVVGLVLSGLVTSMVFASFLSFFSLGGLIFLVLASITAFQTLR
jgi:MFS family permease